MITHRERFRRTIGSQPVDRLPVIEWAGWWNQTVDRWHTEGLPGPLTDALDIRTYWGLDTYIQRWIGPRGPDCPTPAYHGAGLIKDEAEYERILPHLYPEDSVDRDFLEELAPIHERGDVVFWISLDGFFWFPRTILGIERHLYAFYDQAKLMHRMNQDLLAYNLRVLDEVCAICPPDFMTFGEDMSYNHGPMISKELFDEFMAPYSREISPRIKAYGTIPFVDTDGDVTDLVPWFLKVGVEGFLPLERQSGVDVLALREMYPNLKMIGAYDKTVMSRGEAATRAEWERLLPVMRQGGYIPAVDHQTPPEVSMADYRIYRHLQDEYCRQAAKQAPKSNQTFKESIRQEGL